MMSMDEGWAAKLRVMSSASAIDGGHKPFLGIPMKTPLEMMFDYFSIISPWFFLSMK